MFLGRRSQVHPQSKITRAKKRFTANESQEVFQDIEIPEYHKFEIQEIYERTRYLENLRIQLGTFAGSINITIIGFAINSQSSGLIYVSTLALFLYMIADLTARRIRKQLYERGIQLEKKYTVDSRNALLHIRYYSNSTDKSRFSHLSFAGFWVPLFAILIEIILAYFFTQFGWTIF